MYLYYCFFFFFMYIELVLLLTTPPPLISCCLIISLMVVLFCQNKLCALFLIVYIFRRQNHVDSVSVSFIKYVKFFYVKTFLWICILCETLKKGSIRSEWYDIKLLILLILDEGKTFNGRKMYLIETYKPFIVECVYDVCPRKYSMRITK